MCLTVGEVFMSEKARATGIVQGADKGPQTEVVVVGRPAASTRCP